MTKDELRKSVDQLGKLRDQLHVLQARERALTDSLRDVLKKRPGKAAKGDKYEAELIACDSVDVTPVAIRRVAGRKFLRCVKVDLKAARRELGAKAVDRLGKKRRAWKVRIVSREPAKAPRRAPNRQ